MLKGPTERAFRLMAAVPVAGCIVEFGVYKGASLLYFAKLAREMLPQVPPIYGFDSFAGMPPTQQHLQGDLAKDWAKGTFGDTSLEPVQARLVQAGVKAKLIKGVFADLAPLQEYGIDRVRLAHVDADIYEGYRDALRLLTPHLQIGSVILFDESVPPNDWRYQSVRDHGQRAVREWENETGVNLHLIRFEWTVALCVVVDEDYLRRQWRTIDRLRKDTIGESVRNIGRIILGRDLEARVYPKKETRKPLRALEH
jgi:hypothetical protein